ncbi:hypothetical protein OHS33_00295 [Streptomyces sp. NBC_00536]|uniref:hypothetical protein n=1 Tax=Streptomyces sp. NBC_00536 TaxID=2975769 RepID=UPI002E8150B2|nr:hypothetical protein [Streptomyces sp. NBC_00536]WUC76922.1 hypothetical protein OHS33_00295 [Streptomyces sp. NBC_00536]
MSAVFAQPFLLSTTVDERRRRHVPDFLALRKAGVPLVVDVKPRHLLTRPKVTFALGWAREVVFSRGWGFEVWCEPPEAELADACSGQSNKASGRRATAATLSSIPTMPRALLPSTSHSWRCRSRR